MLSNSFDEVNITLIPKPNNDGIRKENYISFSLMNLDVKTLKTVLVIDLNFFNGSAEK